MSDDEYQYEDDYADDYENNDPEEAEDEELIAISNAYYEGDEKKDSNPEEAIEEFKKVVSLGPQYQGDSKKEVDETVFNSVRDLVLIYLKLGKMDQVTDYYRQLMQKMGSEARSSAEGAITKVLDTLERQQLSAEADGSIRGVYEMTLTFVESKYETFFIKISLRFGNFIIKSLARRAEFFSTKNPGVSLEEVNEVFCTSSYDRNDLRLKAFDYLSDLQKLDEIIVNLKRRCQVNGRDDWSTKATSLMEIYYLETQLCSITHNIPRLRKIYPRDKFTDIAAVVEPKVLGGIREEGGKMYMSEKEWANAHKEFVSSFFNYQQTNTANALRVLKYTVFIEMFLSDSEVTNLLNSKEAKVYKDNAEIKIMENLTQTLKIDDLVEFERILKASKMEDRKLGDAFLCEYIAPLRRSIRERVLKNKIQPYVRVDITFLSQELSSEEYPFSREDVKSILIDQIVSGHIKGFVDDLQDCVVVEKKSSMSGSSSKYKMLSEWVDFLAKTTDNLVSNV